MTYFNPEIYNYENLKENDKAKIDHMRLVRDEIEGVRRTLLEDSEVVESTLDKIVLEVKADGLDDMLARYEMLELELMVGMIEGYDD